MSFLPPISPFFFLKEARGILFNKLMPIYSDSEES